MGIDLERFPEVNSELTCSICAGVLEDPVELPCQHVFCSPCISRWLSSNHSCPNCRKKAWSRDQKPALPLLKNIISKLKIRCDFVQHGCTEIVELDRLGAHTSDCPFAPMTCENAGCEITFPRRSKAEHEAECPERVISCTSTCSQGCGLQLRLAELPGHDCVRSLKSRVEQLEQKVSDYSQRMLTLEETVKELKKHKGGHGLYPEYSKRSGLSSSFMEFEASGQRNVDSGLISFLSEDEESNSFLSSPTVGLGGTTPTDTVTLCTLEGADELISGHRERPWQRSLRQSPLSRDRSRSRSPLRQNASEDGTSRRDRGRSPSESTRTSRTAYRPRRPVPVTSSSPSASSTCTSTNTCGNRDSSVFQLTERRQNSPSGIDESSSEDSPQIIGEVWHNVTLTEALNIERSPERAYFWLPPGARKPSAYFGDRRVQQWLNRVIGDSASSRSSNHSSRSSNHSCSNSTNSSSSSPSTSC